MRCKVRLAACFEEPYRRNQGTQQFSITALTDSAATIKERYAYTAYGQLTITDASGTTRTATAEGNRYTYTGREWDDVAELYHFRARMYDPLSGRFLSRDPDRFRDGMSLYEYVHANPQRYVDPRGTCGWQINNPFGVPGNEDFGPKADPPDETDVEIFITVVLIVTICTPIPGDEVLVGTAAAARCGRAARCVRQSRTVRYRVRVRAPQRGPGKPMGWGCTAHLGACLSTTLGRRVPGANNSRCFYCNQVCRRSGTWPGATMGPVGRMIRCDYWNPMYWGGAEQPY